MFLLTLPQPYKKGGNIIVLEKETGYVDAQEAARRLGMNKRALRNLVARMRLEKSDGGGAAARLLVSVTSVEKLRSKQ